MAIKTFEQENLHCKYHKIRSTYGIKISGIPLDDEIQDIITFEMQESLQSIICYDYEDGKPWHDLTCVMELIFSEQHWDTENKTTYEQTYKIRYLYDHPWNLFRDFAALTAEYHCDRMIAVRMDLTAGWFQHDNKDKGICFDDFEIFNCNIKHKKHFHPKNPEMTDD